MKTRSGSFFKRSLQALGLSSTLLLGSGVYAETDQEIESYNKAVDFFNSGLALAKNHKYTEAIASYQKSLASSPMNETYRALLDTMSEAGLHNEAIALAKKYLQSQPNNAQFKDNLLECYDNYRQELYEKDKYNECITVCKEILILKPNAEDALGSMGYCYSQLNKHDESIDAYTKLEKLGKAENPDFLELSKNLMSLCRYDEAVKAAKSGIALCSAKDNENKKTMWNNLAICLYSIRRFPESIDAYNHAIALSTDAEYITSTKALVKFLQDIIKLEAVKVHDGQSDYVGSTEREGKIYWKASQMPLKVYIKPAAGVQGYKDVYRNQMIEAFNDWKNASKGKLEFAFVDNPDKANITCHWASSTESTSLSNAGESGECNYDDVNEDGTLEKCSITVLTDIGKDEDEYSAVTAKSTYLHEIGHALGLQGHSPDPGDVMFYFVSRVGISQRDANTIAALYESRK